MQSHRTVDAALRFAAPLAAMLALAGHASAAPAGDRAPRAPSLPRDEIPSAVPVIPVSDVRPGMEGYGLTVFSGTVPDRFHVVVIGVLHNFLPKQDVILIKSDDPRLLYSGVVKGMSGSPIYLDGKLAGALAYAWSFAKDAIAGVTPIQNMQAELERPVRGPDATLMADAGQVDVARFRRDPFAPMGRSLPAVSLDAAAPAHGGVDGRDSATVPELFHLLPLPRRPVIDGASRPRLVRAAVPLMVSGLPPSSIAVLQEALSPYGLDVMAGGGAGGPGEETAGPDRFGFGDSIGVELARGDVSMTGVGTVTYVDGPHVLGFGHPMFDAGELYLPIASADVHTVLSSLESSFKMASPLRELGTLVEDRQSCIVGDMSRRAPVVPIDITVTGSGPPREFHTEVARHKFLTPMIAEQVVTGALSAAVSDVSAATVTVDGTLQVAGAAPLELVDSVYSQDGLSQGALSQVRAIRYLGPLLLNPFAPLELDRVDLKIDVTFKPLVAELESAYVADATLPPGGRVDVYATLKPFGGPEEVKAIPIDVPAALAGQSVKILVESGAEAKPDVAPPENLSQLLDALRKSYPAKSIVVTVLSADEGVLLRGEVVPDLPPSVLDSLRPVGSSERGDAFHAALRVVAPTERVIQGRQEISVKVREEK